MHDTDSLAQMPVLDSIAGQPSLEEMIYTFEKECEVSFKEEIYLVRDNGAVCRRPRPKYRRRRLDEVWTFGTLNRHSGYFEINGHVVHRVVANAFHGPQPSPDHVVDHIDTNKQNNRADNLRWVTRLENILLNPITCARIVLAYGSLEAFFENPGASIVPNWDWMRVVTKEQAQRCRERLLEWAEKGQASIGGSLGDWLFKSRRQSAVPPRRGVIGSIGPEPETLDTASLTAHVFQRKWRTPSEFPQCPENVSHEGLKSYLGSLTAGAVFCRNRYGEYIVVEAGISAEGVLSVVCGMPPGVKSWSHAKVYIERATYCHESGRTFFTQEGAMKAHCITIGAPFDEYDDSFDDYC